MNSNTDIAVLGMAGRFPGAPDLDIYWQNLLAGKDSGIRLGPEQLRAAGLSNETISDPKYVPVAQTLAGIAEFDAQFFGFSAREAALLDPQHRLMLQCAWHALEDAAISVDTIPVTGVYLSVNMPAYLISNLLCGASWSMSANTFELQIHNDKDYIASRVAHRLGLTGPAIAVQTACSSSLVAIHAAVQALLNGECELALAGGCAVRVPHHVGYFYEEGLIFSPDGRTRPFDADAQGTVFGSGVGAVVLGRLSDVLSQGRQPLAVIRSSAVNNDGISKVGFTAPSVSGQAAVVGAALEVAGLDAREIDAIEAHGTGTALGDPLEIKALRAVFAEYTDERGFCGVSSVKGNIGHLESAAGIASFIKAVQQIRYRTLAPTANFRVPNPAIDFRATPFVVVDAPTALGDTARIGVSSFGIGGTNAHVIIEQPPAVTAPIRRTSARPRLVFLSARADEALDELAERTAEIVEIAGEEQFSSVAAASVFTRAQLPIRVAACSATSVEMAATLRGQRRDLLVRGTVPIRRPTLVLAFPGQGVQYPGMAANLYKRVAPFRVVFDEVMDALAPHLSIDLRAVLFDRSASAKLITDTALAQPALFAVEYALAATLETRGVVADVMVGHSVGEFAAACRAGVFSLDDAAELVAIRAKLMAEQPRGGMLSIAVSEERLRELLFDGVEIAAINAPALCVASGTMEAVESLSSRLTECGITYRPLHTSHAFHSAMMQPVVDAFSEHVARCELHGPSMPIVSCMSGRILSAEDARNPAYWSNHVRGTVRFFDALETIAELYSEAVVFLEAGPGNSLGTFARQSTSCSLVKTIQTLPRPEQQLDDDLVLTTALGALWTVGLATDVGAEQLAVPSVRLPLYPFRRDEYWAQHGGIVAASPAVTAQVGKNTKRQYRVGISAPYREAEEDRGRTLVALWQEFLGVDTVGIDDNFFELGGHSLMATQILNRYADLTGIRIPMTELLRTPTIAALSRIVAAEDRAEHLTIAAEPAPKSRSEPFPLSPMQQAQWIGRMGAFELGGVAAHVYLEFDSASIDPDKLRAAWQSLVDRHDVLRMVVLPDGTQRFIESPGPIPFTVTNLSQLAEESASVRAEELRSELEGEVRRADTWPLWHVGVTLLPGGIVRTHLSFDLLVADVASLFFQLIPEWEAHYRGVELPGPPELSYRDYVIAEERNQATTSYKRSLEYWREKVKTLPPAPALPMRRNPDGRVSSHFIRLHKRIDASTWQRIQHHATAVGVTPSSALIAAYAVVIGRWSRKQHFTLNLTAVNRLPVHQDVNKIVGEFATFDLLEVDLRDRETFADVAAEIQQRSWEDFDHRQVSGVQILRELARVTGATQSAAMPVVVTSSLTEGGDRGSDPMRWLGEQNYFISQTPQVTLDHFIMQIDGQLELAWHFLVEMFEETMLREMFESYANLVLGLADEDGWTASPEIALPLRQQTDRDRVNDTDWQMPIGLLTDGVFAQTMASDAAERIAIVDARGTLSYAELGTRVGGITQLITQAGYSRGDVIAVRISKGIDQICAVLGVLGAGCTYLPLDPDLPYSRRQWLVEHAGAVAEVAVTDDTSSPAVNAIRLDGTELGTVPTPLADSDDTAYIIYTSGSTGIPKGVAVSHRAARNTLCDINDRFEVGVNDAVFGLSSLSFDLSVYDVFGVLGVGGRLVLPAAEAGRDPQHWHEVVLTNGVTIWNTVPALMEMFVEYCAGRSELPLRLILMSGDWIPVTLPERIRAISPQAKVISLGGATEAAVWSVGYEIGEIDPAWASIPYGFPLRGQRMRVLDERGADAPEYVPGDLYIYGAGVAKGYWNDPQRSAASFDADPRTDERRYRTGDIARYLPGGILEFLGREDFQVKIGGHRIELGEVESALLAIPSVRAAVAAAPGERGHRKLVAYVQGEVTEAEVSEHLSVTLPEYLRPAHIVVMSDMPLSDNGKIDRSALPVPWDREKDGGGDVPMTVATQVLVELVANLLDIDAPSPEDNFFELGGDSILGIQLIARAAERGIEINAPDLFAAPTLSALVDTTGCQEVVIPPDARNATVSIVQRLLFEAHTTVLVPLNAEIDFDLLEQALIAVVSSHQALRSCIREGVWFPFTDGDFSLAEIPLSAINVEQREQRRDFMLAEMASELDPAAGIVFKASLIRDQADCLLAMVASRAILADDSWPVLLDEFTTAYRQVAAGEQIKFGESPCPLRHASDVAHASQLESVAVKELRCHENYEMDALLLDRATAVSGVDALLAALIAALAGTGLTVVAETTAEFERSVGHFGRPRFIPPQSGLTARDAVALVADAGSTQDSVTDAMQLVLLRRPVQWTVAPPARRGVTMHDGGAVGGRVRAEVSLRRDPEAKTVVLQWNHCLDTDLIERFHVALVAGLHDLADCVDRCEASSMGDFPLAELTGPEWDDLLCAIGNDIEERGTGSATKENEDD